MREALNPWHPITDTVDLKHLGKLGEESGELSTATNRCIIQGMDGVNPSSGQVNREWLEDEMADVYANMELTQERFGLDVGRIMTRAFDKKLRLRTWHKMD